MLWCLKKSRWWIKFDTFWKLPRHISTNAAVMFLMSVVVDHVCLFVCFVLFCFVCFVVSIKIKVIGGNERMKELKIILQFFLFIMNENIQRNVDFIDYPKKIWIFCKINVKQ